MPTPSIPNQPSKSLIASLADGSAGVSPRIIVSLAGGCFLFAVSSILAYALAAAFSADWSVNRSGGMLRHAYVDDQLVAISFLFGGVLYLIFLYWVWSRHKVKRGLWVGGGITIGIGLVTAPLCLLVEEFFQGSSEFLVAGVIGIAAGAVLLLWLSLYRRYTAGRTLRDKEGVIDLRCPECQYRMVGLKEARCPECGREYTLDELVRRQNFEVLRTSRGIAGQSAPSMETSSSEVTLRSAV